MKPARDRFEKEEIEAKAPLALIGIGAVGAIASLAFLFVDIGLGIPVGFPAFTFLLFLGALSAGIYRWRLARRIHDRRRGRLRQGRHESPRLESGGRKVS